MTSYSAVNNYQKYMKTEPKENSSLMIHACKIKKNILQKIMPISALTVINFTTQGYAQHEVPPAQVVVNATIGSLPEEFIPHLAHHSMTKASHHGRKHCEETDNGSCDEYGKKFHSRIYKKGRSREPPT